MSVVLTVFIILASLLMIGIVLVQKSKGGLSFCKTLLKDFCCHLFIFTHTEDSNISKRFSNSNKVKISID